MASVQQQEPKSSENKFLKVEPQLLLSITAGAPFSLNETILPAKLNGIEVKSLLDTDASECFVNGTVIKSAELHVHVSMASDQLITSVPDKECRSLSVQGDEY